MRKMNLMKSEKHEIFGVKVNKIALSANDDKRFILPDRIHTLAWGHYKIKQNGSKKHSFQCVDFMTNKLWKNKISYRVIMHATNSDSNLITLFHGYAQLSNTAKLGIDAALLTK